jgi:hypothetical protein
MLTCLIWAEPGGPARTFVGKPAVADDLRYTSLAVPITVSFALMAISFLDVLGAVTPGDFVLGACHHIGSVRSQEDRNRRDIVRL